MENKNTILAISNRMYVRKTVWESVAERELKQIKKDHEYMVGRYGKKEAGKLTVSIQRNGATPISR
jgi:hypothetical protein